MPGSKKPSKPSVKKGRKKVKRNVNRTLPVEQGPSESIKFTYFAACGNYPKKGYEYLPNVWWTQNHFGQQLWKEIDNSNKQYANLGPKYGGVIPLEVLLEKVADEMFNNKDFQKVYKNWAYRYQVGTARYVNGRFEEKTITKKNAKGEPYPYTYQAYKADLETRVQKTIEDSRGSPPLKSYTKEERQAYREASE